MDDIQNLKKMYPFANDTIEKHTRTHNNLAIEKRAH